MNSERAPLLGAHFQTQPTISRRSDFSQKIEKWIHVIFNLELAMALHAFASGIHGVIVTNLYIDKACRVNLNFTSDVCDNINDHESENNEVQIIVSTLVMYSMFLTSIPCILVSMVLGAWSDRNGRKPLLIIPTIGSIVCQLTYMTNVFYANARAEFLLFSSIYSLFGGYTTIMLGTYSYLADTTSETSRTSRISVLHVLASVGYTFGNFLSPYVYESWGFYGTFGTTIALLLTSMLFIVIFIKEPPRIHSENENIRDRYHTPLASIREASRSVLKKRPGYRRRVILILLGIMLLLVASSSGGGGGYLFTRKMFHWDEKIYTEVGTLMTVLSTFSNLLLLPLLSYTMEIPDSIIGVMATMSNFSDLLVTALAQTGTTYIFAKCLGLMGEQSSITIRSLLSKVVPKSDLGKVYSMLGCLENIVPLIFSPILTYTYNTTLDTFPGAVYGVSACITGIGVCCFVYVSFLVERNPDLILIQQDSREKV